MDRPRRADTPSLRPVKAAFRQEGNLSSSTTGRSAGQAATTLAIERTYAAVERTLMASVRTSLSLIGFGFTIYLLFTKGARAALVPADPIARYFAMGLMSLGVLVLALGIWGRSRTELELEREVGSLHATDLDSEAVAHQRSSAFALAALALVLGIVGLASMAFHVLD
jgi:inner membrane protein YidH